MAVIKIPVFKSGAVLTHDMLETLKQYSMQSASMEYAEYGDGIISGFRVSVSEEILNVSKGILSFQGNVLFVSNDMKVQIEDEDSWQLLVLQVGSFYTDQNFKAVDLQLKLESETKLTSNKIEICRFKRQKGAALRCKYKDFYDLNTEFDTINEISARWAAYQGDSVSNRILAEFAQAMMRKGTVNEQDAAFVQNILQLNGKSMNRAAVSYYIAVRLGKEYELMGNEKIYQSLCEVLKNCNRNTRRESSDRFPRRLIVE